jgi:hypothetical protein
MIVCGILPSVLSSGACMKQVSEAWLSPEPTTGGHARIEYVENGKVCIGNIHKTALALLEARARGDDAELNRLITRAVQTFVKRYPSVKYVVIAPPLEFD